MKALVFIFMEKLIYTINGVNYVLFEAEIIKNSWNEFKNKVNDCRGIFQSYRMVNGFFEQTRVHVKVLIPEDKAIEFGKVKN